MIHFLHGNSELGGIFQCLAYNIVIKSSWSWSSIVQSKGFSVPMPRPTQKLTE